MSNLPAPPIPAYVDLTEYAFIQLDVRRLRDSRIAATVTGDEFRCAVLLWCASWHQVPSGSLPDDDVELAQLAGFGRMVAAWRDVKAGAMYGFVQCSDGRHYHPVVVEKAVDGWNKKQFHHWKKECDRLRKENKTREARGEDPLSYPDRPAELKQGAALSEGSVARSHGIPNETADFPAETYGVSSGTAELSDGIPAENALRREGEGEGDSSTNLTVGCPEPDKPVRTRNAYPDDFLDWWGGYPTDPLMSKKAAGTAWGKLTKQQRAAAIASNPGFRAYCEREKSRGYRPVHAVKYLNEHRFDGFAPAAPTSADPIIDFGRGYRAPESTVVSMLREGKWLADWGDPPGQPGCVVPRHLWPESATAGAQ